MLVTLLYMSGVFISTSFVNITSFYCVYTIFLNYIFTIEPFHCRSTQGFKHWISSFTLSSLKSRCKKKETKFAPSGFDVKSSHVNLVAVELLQYANLL